MGSYTWAHSRLVLLFPELDPLTSALIILMAKLNAATEGEAGNDKWDHLTRRLNEGLNSPFARHGLIGWI